jgi:hypothetical protein
VTKRIEYDLFEIATGNGRHVKLDADHGIDLWIDAEEYVTFCSPNDLDRFGDECKRAAAAWRKAQQVTFGDLKPGEWFKWASTGHQDYGLLKLDEQRIVNPTHRDPLYRLDMTPCDKDTPVIRLRITFTPEEQAR